MTIGIGATGESAGFAVWRALNRVERVASGSVGGFATFGVLTADSEARQFTTQRGGSRTLFTDGEDVLNQPPTAVRDAPVAGVISSGPDRPEPLTQFLPVVSDVGLVTGHRFPNAVDADGVRLNRQVIDFLAAGQGPTEAVGRVADENPTVDAGLIAVDADGRVGARNTDLVRDRNDLAGMRRGGNGARVAVLNNSIQPGGIVADLAAETAMTTMRGGDEPDFSVTVTTEATVEHGDENTVVVEDDTAVRIVTTDETLLTGERNGAVPYYGSTVVRDGTVLGRTVEEANTILDSGSIVSLSGQDRVQLGVVRTDDRE